MVQKKEKMKKEKKENREEKFFSISKVYNFLSGEEVNFKQSEKDAQMMARINKESVYCALSKKGLLVIKSTPAFTQGVNKILPEEEALKLFWNRGDERNLISANKRRRFLIFLVGGQKHILPIKNMSVLI